MKQKDVLLVIIPLSVFTAAWVGFSIYHNIVASTISKSLNIAISPINPNFDTRIIKKIEKRTKVVPLYQLKTNLSENTASSKPKANLLPAGASSGSASVTVTPSTSSAILSPSQGGSSPSANGKTGGT
ncbi:MAG: hypothetical protein M1277_01040 [Patescibacteria group bacterium]|nr:hypothetical protein [Patescibacteria group bacterium]